MTAVTTLQTQSYSVSHRDAGPREKSRRYWTWALFGSAVGGAIAGVCGLFIGLVSLLGLTDSRSALAVVGTLMVAVSFPLFLLAAHCLDRIHAIDWEIRLEYCREHGLSDIDR
jgi:uncharacterized membrane protein YfcA